jgi:uncharacterized iron-regulated protein
MARLTAVLALASVASVARPASGEMDALASIAERAPRAEVIAIGESHDNPAHHAIQTRIVEHLVALGERPVLAFEMLSEDQQPEVDAALAESASSADLERRLAWRARGWPDFGMYYPLFAAARRHRLPVLAADLDAASRRAIARGGLDALAEPERARAASRLASDPAREQALRQELQTAHCGVLSLALQASMADAWHARNVTMARRTADALAGDGKVVLIVGRAHLGADAVPAQLEAVRRGTRLLIVDLVEADADVPLPNADVVWVTPGVTRPDRCAELHRHPPPAPS